MTTPDPKKMIEEYPDDWPVAAIQKIEAAEDALEAAQKENERLTGELKEDRRFCICGCPVSEHEDYGEDGESCGNPEHECLRACAAVVSLHLETRKRAEAAEAQVASLKTVLNGVLPAARRARFILSSRQMFDFNNEQDERRAKEFGVAIDEAERALAGPSREPQPDAEGHCRRCGLPWNDNDTTHECQGFKPGPSRDAEVKE